jgi:hypothetical protein
VGLVISSEVIEHPDDRQRANVKSPEDGPNYDPRESDRHSIRSFALLS